MDKKNRAILLKNTQDFKEFREADVIISYLANPDAETRLSAFNQKKLDRYVFIHGLRMRYQKHSYVIAMLKKYHNRNERQARTDIIECEYVFGKVLKIDREFEKAFLLEAGRENLKIAFKTRDVAKISQAIKVYLEVLGPDSDLSELPDFSKFEQHNYNIVLPPGIEKLLLSLSEGGAIDLSKLLPNKLM